MCRPEHVEILYLDFDGFFASVAQQADPKEIPIDVVKSIDELACMLDTATSADPRGLSQRIKDRLRRNVGEQITGRIGIAANRLLAKVACKVDKPKGITIWHPADMPAPLLARPMSDIPGVGDKIAACLAGRNITTIEGLLGTTAQQLRSLWENVNGEGMWYALHGYQTGGMLRTSRRSAPGSRKATSAHHPLDGRVGCWPLSDWRKPPFSSTTHTAENQFSVGRSSLSTTRIGAGPHSPPA